ncbi:MAG: metallophosphoesterase [Lachnospiraceae bacterium]|nr:metallophosphoesterase [Lachnospiraceae bacterium]
MKWKTRIISALIHAAVLLACFGVLFVLVRLTEPDREQRSSGPAQETSQEAESRETETETEAESGTESLAEGEGEESREEYFTRGYGDDAWETVLEDMWTPPKEEPYVPPTVILATDLHYQSHQADDRGQAFQTFVENCDGKVVEYLPELLEAFLDEVIEKEPSALVLSGDITMNGESINHQELTERLRRVQDAGIQVLVIPGNHDINNTNAAVYFGDEKKQTPSVTGDEFLELYYDYGYDQAFSRDETSLSYAYALDEKNWLLMLDSAQYDPVNRVEGRIRDTTLEWMEGVLQEAEEKGVFVLPIAHHNLLSQSRMYTTQCTMENHLQVIELLEKYGCPLFLSGHLHVQRIHQYRSEPGVPQEEAGIREIVTDALSIPPCQYGVLEWKEDGSLEYSTAAVNVSAWAAETGNENPDLLDFEDWSYRYIRELISSQIASSIRNLGEEITWSMAGTYASVYMDYYAGRAINKEDVRSTKGYRWWQRNLPDSPMLQEMEAMMADSDRDNNYLLIPEAL